MSEFWQIIGLSSLIASIINIMGNFISNIYVAKKSFQREKEAGYIKSQIQLYYKIYFLMQRLRLGATNEVLFQSFIDEIKELNNVMKDSSFLLEAEILIKWFEINILFPMIGKTGIGPEQQKKRMDLLYSTIDEINSLIRKQVNKFLNPRYKEVVGKTVPDLAKVELFY